MRYRLTTLTPLLVGDGQRLSPIDYMVWKDQISVLDQHRIFRLLSRGPRLEGYLTQLRRADKLDFASWGGFAQNYAERRIPFESSALTPAWEKEPAENLFIPTFCSGPNGPYLPGSAVKGSLRTALAFSRWNEGVLRELLSRQGDRPMRRPGEAAEAMTLGTASSDSMRGVSLGDSAPITPQAFRVYMIRVSTLVARGQRFELAWKPKPTFAEMAPPRTQFTGIWKQTSRVGKLFQAANEHAGKLLEMHWHYAEASGMTYLKANIDSVGHLLAETSKRRNACIVNLGYGGGFLSKAAFLDTANEEYRKLLRMLPYYERAIRSGMPFPKTRRVIFERGQPANLAGWALLELV